MSRRHSVVMLPSSSNQLVFKLHVTYGDDRVLLNKRKMTCRYCFSSFSECLRTKTYRPSTHVTRLEIGVLENLQPT